MQFEKSLAFARRLDQNDTLAKFRKEFHLPRLNGKTCIYLTGNSLGLLPKNTQKWVNEELTDWAKLGVEGHVHAKRPWLYYHKFTKKALTRLTGAKPVEVVAMNQLTVNLHLMMISFYQPTRGRFKIITERGAFSSDQYAFESQLKMHGLSPDTALVEIAPRQGEHTLRTEDIVDTILQHGASVALVIFGGVQYYTGQLFDIRAITQAAHRVGAFAGFDLAHAIGNVPLQLHKHEVDFAVWCSYKYLNSGPGGVAGAFVHEKHARNTALPRLAGWWGHFEKKRFQMRKGFIPMEGVDGWQLSNFPVLSGAAHLAALDVFERAGIQALRKKSLALTGFLHWLLINMPEQTENFQLITPGDPSQRGCQISIFMLRNGKKVFDRLTKAGIVADWREPNVIRVAPVPLYNTFEEVFRFAQIFERALLSK